MSVFTSVITLIVPLFTSTTYLMHTPTTTRTYTLSLHDALPICEDKTAGKEKRQAGDVPLGRPAARERVLELDEEGEREREQRSEEHTSELQSLTNLVCRLQLEKKKYTEWVLTSRTGGQTHSTSR